ncbi:DUF4097 family beta strand repeat-containing protein [Streptomyces sp. NPDC021749]|uniref:DUF4097 family beta strand repeat-containing protein n=1 Tax=Streptomyces sp. NPDC021749 TaxID=3154905 RepID=UPI0033E3B6CD
MLHRHQHRTRPPRRALVGAAVAVVGVCGLGACGLLPGKTFEDDATLSKKITAVRLDTDSGGVTVRGGKGSGKNGDGVSLHRSVEYHGDRPEGATHRVEDGVLVLGGCGDACSVTYTVDLPAGLPVSGETSNGAVHLSKVGAVKVTTSSGAVALDGVTGPVDVRTSNGRITGRGLSGGHLTAETSNGAIDLTPARPQDVRAKTSNGSVTVRMPKGRYAVSAHTSNGAKHIALTDDPSARYRLDLTTSNGDITAKAA